ncbi:hypothetical protein ES332_D02G168800v1 [Gossypium tomentosum]|uniref:Uncharacterized protein n=1 Tax=Gossypium tomentosum TaxID=34277 RepID=A0A5D2LY88_GOSTO|nr:hypothetical protein ES332_D02G168800v1 [Gossypium tomentosum]
MALNSKAAMNLCPWVFSWQAQFCLFVNFDFISLYLMCRKKTGLIIIYLITNNDLLQRKGKKNKAEALVIINLFFISKKLQANNREQEIKNHTIVFSLQKRHTYIDQD